MQPLTILLPVTQNKWDKPKLCHGHLTRRLLSVDLPKIFWLNSLPRCHLEKPNQMPEAIIIHWHSLILEGLRTSWIFRYSSTNLHRNRQYTLPTPLHHIFQDSVLSHSPPCIYALGITWPGSQESQHTSKRMKQSAAVSMPDPLSFYYSPKAFKSLDSINASL